MLLLKTYVAPSKIHGLGLFAAEPINKGALIWLYVDGFDRKLPGSYVDSLPEIAREHIRHYCALLKSGEYLNE